MCSEVQRPVVPNFGSSTLLRAPSLNRLPGRGNQRSGREIIDHPKFNILAKDSRDSFD